MKEGFERTISWNKYRSEKTTQTKNRNLHYAMDPTLRNINRFFLFSLKNGGNDPKRDSYDRYYMRLVEIRDFTVLIDNNPIFDQPVQNKREAHKKLVKISKINDYVIGNILNYLQHQNYYRLISIDLSRKKMKMFPSKLIS